MEGRKRTRCRIKSAFPGKQSAKKCVRNERSGRRNERETQEDGEYNRHCKPATRAKPAEAAGRVDNERDRNDPHVSACVDCFSPFRDPKAILEGQIGGNCITRYTQGQNSLVNYNPREKNKHIAAQPILRMGHDVGIGGKNSGLDRIGGAEPLCKVWSFIT